MNIKDLLILAKQGDSSAMETLLRWSQIHSSKYAGFVFASFGDPLEIRLHFLPPKAGENKGAAGPLPGGQQSTGLARDLSRIIFTLPSIF